MMIYRLTVRRKKMKKLIICITMTSLLFLFACQPDQPAAPELNTTVAQLAQSKMIAIGNSLTAGFQSSGLTEDFQLNSYPYMVARQMGKTEFEQPIIGAPGIGSPAGKTPMYLEDGEIKQDDLTVDPLLLLKNAYLARPYDNLGIPGAVLNDLLNTASSAANPFFTLVLRNPTFGNTTQLEQAVMLQPTMILLWAGDNDMLNAVLDGDMKEITSQVNFSTQLQEVLTQLRADLPRTMIVIGNIRYATDIPYVNILDHIFIGPGNTPVLFDDTLQPINAPGVPGGHLPLLTTESDVEHITLKGLLAYQSGLGVPDSTYMVDILSIDPFFAKLLVNAIRAAGVEPSGVPLDGTMTLTATETSALTTAVDGYNQTIAAMAQSFQTPMVDLNALFAQLHTADIDGASGKFVLLAPANTAFSLDGVHPNHAGYALIANVFIETIDAVLQPDPAIPTVDISSKLGQYLPAPGKIQISEAIRGVPAIFRSAN
jgi:lysophospholipase L1-like esterase